MPHPDFGPGADASVPSICVDSLGGVHIAKRGDSPGWFNSLIYFQQSSGAWSSQSLQGPPISFPPSICVDSTSGNVSIAVQADNSLLYYLGTPGNPTSWSAPQPVTANGFPGPASQPSISAANGMVYIASQATDSTLWLFTHASFSGSQWSGAPVKGNSGNAKASFPPSMVVRFTGEVDIAALDSGNTLTYYSLLSPSSNWSAIEVSSGLPPTNYAPSMVVLTDGSVEIVVLSPQNQLVYYGAFPNQFPVAGVPLVEGDGSIPASSLSPPSLFVSTVSLGTLIQTLTMNGDGTLYLCSWSPGGVVKMAPPLIDPPQNFLVVDANGNPVLFNGGILAASAFPSPTQSGDICIAAQAVMIRRTSYTRPRLTSKTTRRPCLASYSPNRREEAEFLRPHS
jgi:hypothetical protein